MTHILFGIMLSICPIATPTVASLLHSQTQHSIAPEANSLVSESSLVQSAQLADVLMGIIAFGIPGSMLFAGLLHSQLAAERDRLAAQLVPIRVKSKS
jgi:hypothetical protein